MGSTSPPLTPVRRHEAPVDTTADDTFQDDFKRRSSSFTSNHERSPVTSKARHRFSNASHASNDFDYPTDDAGGGGAGGGGGGMGNLADELDQLDDEYEYDEDVGDTTQLRTEGGPDDSIIEGARDSGIDVSYPPTSQDSPSRPRNFSKPLVQEDKPPDAGDNDEDDRFSPDLEDLVATIARMTAYTTTTEDPLIPRTTALLHDLGPQSNLEAGIQRFTTATNSMTAYATAQTKSLQVLTQSLFSPLFFSGAYAFDAELVDETVPLIDALLLDIPGGTNSSSIAAAPQQPPSSTTTNTSDQSLVTASLCRLSRDTADVLAALSTLTDTLQMGKQITTTAARHLRTTQAMVAELLRERERAETARGELLAGGWHEKIRERRCGEECRGIVEGFREVCGRLGEEGVVGGS